MKAPQIIKLYSILRELTHVLEYDEVVKNEALFLPLEAARKAVSEYLLSSSLGRLSRD